MNDLIIFLYNYCTDFIISLANISGLSYYEINAIIFCLLYPISIVLFPTIYLIQRLRLRKLRQL